MAWARPAGVRAAWARPEAGTRTAWAWPEAGGACAAWARPEAGARAADLRCLLPGSYDGAAGTTWTAAAWPGAVRPGLGRRGGGDRAEVAAAMGICWRRRERE